MRGRIILIFTSLLASCQEPAPLDEGDSSIEEVREETVRSQNELKRINKEIELEGQRQAKEIEERAKEQQK